MAGMWYADALGVREFPAYLLNCAVPEADIDRRIREMQCDMLTELAQRFASLSILQD